MSTPLDQRARIIMTLAMGVGITNIESERLIAEKLDEFASEDYEAGYNEGLKVERPDDGPEYEGR